MGFLVKHNKCSLNTLNVKRNLITKITQAKHAMSRSRAEISWIYPPRFPKMKNNIKIKTYIKCIHRPAYAYDRPHLNPSDPPLLICVHLYASTFVSPHFPSSTFIYLHVPLSPIISLRLPSFPIICPYLPPSALICLYSSSSHLICLHLRSSTVIFLHFPSSALIYHHLH